MNVTHTNPTDCTCLASILGANILIKRKAISAFRNQLASQAATAGHWLVTEYQPSKISAFLNTQDGMTLVKRLADETLTHEVISFDDWLAYGKSTGVVETDPTPQPGPAFTPEPPAETPEPFVSQTVHGDGFVTIDRNPPPSVTDHETPQSKPKAAKREKAARGSSSAIEDAIRAIAEQAASGGDVDEDQVREIAGEVVGERLEEFSETMTDNVSRIVAVSMQDSMKQVEVLINAAVSQIPARKIEIKGPSGNVVKLDGATHYKFQLVAASIAAGVPVLMTGPAGTGKTTMAMQAAKALEMDCRVQAFSPMTTKADLLGYMDANGVYRESAFVHLFQHGGLFVADEFDAMRPDVGVILNSAIANRVLVLPTGEQVKAHEGWQVAACANTFGTGPDALYTGRNRLDASTLDRFFVVVVPLDDSLEAAMVGISIPAPNFRLDDGGIEDAGSWLATVTRARNALEAGNVQAVVSPRATVMGVMLFAAGVGYNHVVNGLLRKGLTGAALNTLNAAL